MKVLGLTLLTALVCGTSCLTWDDLKKFIEEETAKVTKRELVIWDDGKSTPMVCPDGKAISSIHFSPNGMLGISCNKEVDSSNCNWSDWMSSGFCDTGVLAGLQHHPNIMDTWKFRCCDRPGLTYSWDVPSWIDYSRYDVPDEYLYLCGVHFEPSYEESHAPYFVMPCKEE